MENEVRKKGKFPKWPFFVFGLPPLLLVLAIVILSSPDQIRTVQVSDNPFAPLIQGDQFARTGPMAEPPVKVKPKPNLIEIAKLNYPLPNMTNWPSERQEKARVFQAEMSELLAEYLALPEKTRRLPFADACKQLEELDKKIVPIYQSHKEMINHWCSSTERQALLKKHQDICNMTLTALYTERGEWLHAAQMYVYTDWDKATYFARKDGAKGRCALALWSFMRCFRLGAFK